MIGVGMIGGGNDNQGIPALVTTLERLSESVDITVYSFIPVRSKIISSRIRVRHVIIGSLPNPLKSLFLFALFSIDHLIRPYDCIHTQSPFPAGWLALRLRSFFRIRWVTTIHAGEIANIPELQFGDIRNRKIKTISEKVCSATDELIFMSHRQAGDLFKNLNIRREFRVLPRGIIVPELHSKTLTRPLKLLHVGYFYSIKNQLMLLDTLRSLLKSIPCELKIIGANYDEEFQSQISARGLSNAVTVFGTVPNDQMKNHYHEAHVILHTSWFEGMPMVAIEAMAYGAVVCGTDVGIMADLSGDCCVTVRPGDAEALAREVIDLVNNPAKYDSYRQRAHQWASSHDINWHVDNLLALYFPPLP